MEIEELLFWGLGCAFILILLFFSRSVLTFVGTMLIRRDIFQRMRKLGLIEHQVRLPSGILTWYIERACDGPCDGPPLVVLPGATVNMGFMGIRLSRLIQSLPGRRIIIVELPFHGRNVSEYLEFNGQANSLSSMAKHLEEICSVLGILEPIDLLGYSLGGGISTKYALAHPQRIHRMILLAPFFYETVTDEFAKKFDSKDWRSIHAWERLSEMEHFFHHWLGLPYAHTPPHFVMRGIHAIRCETFPRGYWSSFFDVINEHSSADRTFIADQGVEFQAFQRPTLVCTAQWDAICDSDKLNVLDSLFGSDMCTILRVPCGHFFGRKGTTLFQLTHTKMMEFLSDDI